MLALGSPPPTYFNVSAATPPFSSPPPAVVFNPVPHLVPLHYQPPVGRGRHNNPMAMPTATAFVAAGSASDVGDVPRMYEFDNYEDTDRNVRDRRLATGSGRHQRRRKRGANFYRSDGPKEAKLYSRSSRGFLKVEPKTWSVSIDRHGNSVNGKTYIRHPTGETGRRVHIILFFFLC
jgi:hypothetical protein